VYKGSYGLTSTISKARRQKYGEAPLLNGVATGSQRCHQPVSPEERKLTDRKWQSLDSFVLSEPQKSAADRLADSLVRIPMGLLRCTLQHVLATRETRWSVHYKRLVKC